LEILKYPDFPDCRDCQRALEEELEFDAFPVKVSNFPAISTMEDDVSIDAREWRVQMNGEVDHLLRSVLDNEKTLKAINNMTLSCKLLLSPAPSRQQLSDLRCGI